MIKLEHVISQSWELGSFMMMLIAFLFVDVLSNLEVQIGATMGSYGKEFEIYSSSICSILVTPRHCKNFPIELSWDLQNSA